MDFRSTLTLTFSVASDVNGMAFSVYFCRSSFSPSSRLFDIADRISRSVIVPSKDDRRLTGDDVPSSFCSRILLSDSISQVFENVGDPVCSNKS